uniref:Uncharacterized protein n=1 Tax=Anguilla anguilla TaxID=7936 RepID=A0A0E9PG12_ANGAN
MYRNLLMFFFFWLIVVRLDMEMFIFSNPETIFYLLVNIVKHRIVNTMLPLYIW